MWKCARVEKKRGGERAGNSRSLTNASARSQRKSLLADFFPFAQGRSNKIEESRDAVRDQKRALQSFMTRESQNKNTSDMLHATLYTCT